MKNSKNLTSGVSSTAVQTELRSAYNMTAVPRLVVDWNLNRYTTPTVDNTPSEDTEGFDIEAFPIDSITNPLRPSKGLAKALVGQSIVGKTYNDETDPRFYIGSTDDNYKYWVSPYRTDATGTFPNHTDGTTSVRPTVTYPSAQKANKIVIKVENTWAHPKTYSVLIQTTSGGAWTAIGGTNPTIDPASGVLTLYYNGTTWSTTRPAVLVTTNVWGIRFQVSAMQGGYQKDGTAMTYKKARRNANDKVNWGVLDSFTTDGSLSNLHLISIEPRFEYDMTSRLISTDTQFDMADRSPIYPVGTITTNTASVVLSNDDGLLNPENASSPFYGLLEPNAIFNLEYIYTIAGVQHSVQELRMYSTDWAPALSDGTVTVSLEDRSKFLKEDKPRAMMFQGKRVTEIIWRVLESVGFNDYKIQRNDLTTDHIIPIFWTTGEDTVWEVLDMIAQNTQTAIYFDSYGFLQVRTREAAFKDPISIDWRILGNTSGGNLADLMSLDQNSTYEANKISVTYKATKWKRGTTGKPAMSKVWEPEDENVVLRSSVLVRPIDNSSNYIFLDQKEAKIWPYKSKVQIDGEVIEYEGKQYVYYTNVSGTKTRNVAIITKADDENKYRKLTPDAWKSDNQFTGGLKIIDRGVWNSDKRNHDVDINSWTTKLELNAGGAGAGSNNVRGFKMNKGESTVTINTPGNMKDANDYFWASRGSAAATGYKVYGTRIKFNSDKASTTQRAGIAIKQNGTRENGYYAELCLTNSLDAQMRKNRNEVTLFSRNSGKMTVLDKGHPIAIAPGVWYDLDVYVTGGTQDTISVWLNGQMVAKATTTGATLQPDSGKLSMYARGKTNADFEFVYAVARPEVAEPADDFGFYDLKYGGIRGGNWEREYVWQQRTRYKKIRKKKWVKETYRHNQYLFDEFGPYVHEIREYDVKFDPNPVNYSYIF